MSMIRHIGIVTHYLSRAERFYTNVFGFQIISRNRYINNPFYNKLFNLENVDVTIEKLKDDKDNIFEIIWFQNPKSLKWVNCKLNDIDITHIAITVKNIELVMGDIEQFGGKKGEIVFSEDRKVKLGFAQDVDGNWLEIVQEL